MPTNKKVGTHMRVNKSQAMMFILNTLIVRSEISKKEIKDKLDISDLTFRRYIQEIRAYIVNFEMGYEIIYLKSEDVYILKKI